MKPIKSYTAFLSVFATWQDALYTYTESQLKEKTSPEGWTLGQVYNHLINSALFFHLKQVELCCAGNENQHARKNFKGFLSFHFLNGFPPIKIKVPPSETYTPMQPESKQEIQEKMNLVKEKMAATLVLFETNKKGKTAHPAFAFLNAEAWYKIIEMHWRHHLRQKESMDGLLTK